MKKISQGGDACSITYGKKPHIHRSSGEVLYRELQPTGPEDTPPAVSWCNSRENSKQPSVPMVPEDDSSKNALVINEGPNDVGGPMDLELRTTQAEGYDHDGTLPGREQDNIERLLIENESVIRGALQIAGLHNAADYLETILAEPTGFVELFVELCKFLLTQNDRRGGVQSPSRNRDENLGALPGAAMYSNAQMTHAIPENRSLPQVSYASANRGQVRRPSPGVHSYSPPSPPKRSSSPVVFIDRSRSPPLLARSPVANLRPQDEHHDPLRSSSAEQEGSNSQYNIANGSFRSLSAVQHNPNKICLPSRLVGASPEEGFTLGAYPGFAEHNFAGKGSVHTRYMAARSASASSTSLLRGPQISRIAEEQSFPSGSPGQHEHLAGGGRESTVDTMFQQHNMSKRDETTTTVSTNARVGGGGAGNDVVGRRLKRTGSYYLGQPHKPRETSFGAMFNRQNFGVSSSWDSYSPKGSPKGGHQGKGSSATNGIGRHTNTRGNKKGYAHFPKVMSASTSNINPNFGFGLPSQNQSFQQSTRPATNNIMQNRYSMKSLVSSSLSYGRDDSERFDASSIYNKEFFACVPREKKKTGLSMFKYAKTHLASANKTNGRR